MNENITKTAPCEYQVKSGDKTHKLVIGFDQLATTRLEVRINHNSPNGMSGSLFFTNKGELKRFLVHGDAGECLFTGLGQTRWRDVEKILDYKLIWEAMHDNGYYNLLPEN